MGKRGNGEGSIYYSEKLKRWIGQYTYNGKRKSIYGKTRAEVKDKLNEAIFNIGNNKYTENSKYTLLDIVNKYNEDDYKANIVAEVGYLRRKETAKIIEKMSIANKTIQKINATMINDELLNYTYYSNSVITKIFNMLSASFNKAVLMNIINNNPFNTKGLIIKPKSIKTTKVIEALTIEEQKKLIDYINNHSDMYTDIILISLYSGMRIGEILALSTNDIDLGNKILHINKSLTKDSEGKIIIGKSTKTKKGTRDIPLTNFILEPITKSLKSQNEQLFLYNGKLINPSVVNCHFKRICKNAGIEKSVNTHMLRHTYATRCIEAGMNVAVLSKLLGHADIETTLNTYTSVFNKFKDDEIQKYLDYISNI